MLKLDVSNISPRSVREATAGTLFQFIVYRNKKGKTRDGLARTIFIGFFLLKDFNGKKTTLIDCP